jgi:hypothetical protein
MPTFTFSQQQEKIESFEALRGSAGDTVCFSSVKNQRGTKLSEQSGRPYTLHSIYVVVVRKPQTFL